MQIDFKKPDWDRYEEFLLNENRYSRLIKDNPEEAKELLRLNKEQAIKTFNYYERMSKIEY